MERIRNLTAYQKSILLILLAMAVAFAILYGVVSSRVGFAYQDAILVPNTQDGTTVYSGKIQGIPCNFTVSQDKTVTFLFGDKDYGPYTAQEDPSAIPEGTAASPYVTGLVMRDNGRILFRGSLRSGPGNYGEWTLFDENGELYGFTVTATMSDGTVVDGTGKRIDPMAPSVYTILRLMHGPELTHKGMWPIWALGVFMSLVCALSILFADELFHWWLSLRIQNPYSVDPSDWEIAGRYIGWTILPIAALALYIFGLTVYP